MPISSLPSLTAVGKVLDTSPEAFGELKESNDILNDTAAIRARIKEDGYLFFRGLLNRDEVLAARQEMVLRLEREGLLLPGTDPMDAIARSGPDLQMQFRPDLAQNNIPLRWVLYGGALMEFFERFLGGPVLHYTFTWVRCVAPGQGTGTPPHYDIVYMGRGTKKLYTAWAPMGRIDYQRGGLVILENSHKHERLKQGYGQKDVDAYCINREDDESLHAYGGNGWLTNDPVRLRRSMHGRWLTTEFEPGDVIIFEMFLVHCSLDNQSNGFRLSTDSRYQLASEPADERWIGANPPGHSLAGKRGKIC